jgi:hypothetical protein
MTSDRKKEEHYKKLKRMICRKTKIEGEACFSETHIKWKILKEYK